MNTHDLEAFVAVVETGSIVAASARLHLTQPGVTRRIQNLEDRLGAVLLDRLNKPLRPTASGREAYERGREVLRAIEEMKASLGARSEIKGELRVGLMPYLSEAALTRPLERLRETYPGLSLRVVSAWSPRLLDQALRSELDAAALCLPADVAPPETLRGEMLGEQGVVLVVAHDLPVPDTMSFAELSRLTWVLNESGCGFRSHFRRRFEAAGLPFEVGFEAPSAELRLSLVARGHGIGVVGPSTLADSPLRERVRRVTCPDFAPRVRSWLLHRPPAGRLAGPIALLGEGLREVLAQGAPAV